MRAQLTPRCWCGGRRQSADAACKSACATSAVRTVLPLEVHFVFESFEGVVDDGTVAGAVDQFPHAAEDGAVAADHVGKFLTSFGARIVDGTLVAAQKDAAGLLVALQDESLFFAFHAVIRHYAR